MSEPQKSADLRPITARAAVNGLYISAFICVLLLLLGVGTVVPFCGQLFLIGAVAMPFVSYRLLARNCRRRPLSFPEIWSEGIASFFLGSLVPAAMAYLLLRFAFPNFIYEQVVMTVDVLGSIDSPEATAIVELVGKLLDSGSLPTAADVAANIISFNVVAGTALSFLLAVVLIVSRCISRMRNDNCNIR